MSDYTIITPEFTAAFLNAFEAKENPNGQMKYGTTMLFDPGEDLSQLKAVATKLMTDKFGEDKSKWPKDFRKPWREQAEKAGKYEGFVEGALFVNASTNNPPGILDIDKSEIEFPDNKKIYSGCRMIAHVNLYWYDNVSKGIGVGLNHLMKRGDGTPLGSKAPAVADAFAPVEVNTDAGAGAVFDEGGSDDPMA